jgi:hypothetical protein
MVNEDGSSVIITVVTKQLHYMPITSRLKQLLLSKETTEGPDKATRGGE